MNGLVEIVIYIVLAVAAVFLWRQVTPVARKLDPLEKNVRFQKLGRVGVVLFVVIGLLVPLTLTILIADRFDTGSGSPADSTSAGYATLFYLLIFYGALACVGFLPLIVVHLVRRASLQRTQTKTVSICNLIYFTLPLTSTALLVALYFYLASVA